MKKIADVKDADEHEYLERKTQETLRCNAASEGEHVCFLTFRSKADIAKSTNEINFPLKVPLQISPMKEEDIDKEIRKWWKALQKIPFPKCPPTPEYPKSFYTG